MYHPYFRGKQYELITIRENAPLLAESDFVPIIEPVKETFSGLHRALTAIGAAGGQAAVIVNPFHGDHAEDGERVLEFLEADSLDEVEISPAILLKEDSRLEQIMELCERFDDRDITLVHAGFSSGSALAEAITQRAVRSKHVFLDGCCGRLYRRHFRGADRILVRDGFKRRRNKDHPPVEMFSDLHVTYEDEGMTGFGDFLTVGDEYSEAGGPAYAIAIHLTFIDPEQDDAMFVHHFLSDRQDTPTDPAGKFAEALDSMMATLNIPNSPVMETEAVSEFRQLHRDRHFPGLGYAKKLTMQHHIETLSRYLGNT